MYNVSMDEQKELDDLRKQEQETKKVLDEIHAKQVELVKRLYTSGFSLRRLAEIYGKSHETIRTMLGE